jgi:GAF domain-containing protein
VKRRSRVGGKPPKARHREALKPKHSDASKTASSSGVIQDSEIARLTRELHEAREQQTAASEVLEVISRSPGDLEPVFAAMLENAIHICGARFGGIYGIDGGVLRLLATHNLPEAYETARSTRPFRPGPKHFFRRMMETKTAFQVADAATEQKYLERSPEFVAAVELAGIRTFLVVPMLKENELVGGFLVARQEVRPFTDKQIELVKNFAAQAVIAIENTRLLNELRQRTDDLTGRTADLTEALEQQSATSEVLRVISSSPGDLQPVFEAMLENAVRICDAMGGGICRWDGDALHHVALKWAHPAFAEFLMRTPIHPNPKTSFGHMLATKTVVHVPDLAAQPAYAEQREPGIVTAVEVGHIRTALYVPMLKGSELIGAFTVGSEEVRPFTEKQIDLVSNFAAQAVIAIENARLLSELRESLQQQTGTAGVLRIISSSPGELKPVFDAILENATRICEAAFGTLGLLEGDAFRRVALYNAPPDYVAAHERNPIIERQTAASTLYRLRETKDFVHVADMAAESPDAEITQRGGARTLLVVPMLQENELVGAVGIYRQEVRPFNDKQIDLVKNFAAQAVIAIENARLLNELRESLQQQTATADVLKVISRTTFDLQIVFNTLVESAVRLSDSYDAVILLREGDSLVVRAHNGPIPQDFRKWQLARTWVAGRATVDGRAVHVHDLIAEGEEFPEGHAMALRMGHRTILSVPLLRGDEAIGCLTVRRTDVRPFTEKQITLVTTFADQAVIAIENARLLNELRQRTTDLSEALDQQTATSEVLQTISSSPGDLEPVFAAMLEKAVRICDASFGNIYRWDGGMFSLAASFNTPTAFTEYRKRSPIGVGPATASDHMAKPISTLDSFILQRKVVHIADLTKDQRYIEREPDTVASVELGGVRTVLAAPMLKDNEWIGVLVLSRQEVRSFTDKQIALVTNFASQAVIAIENARLLNELRQSLEQQTATSEVLRVISSSPGDLQPVFTSILANATRICEANFGVLVLYENSVFHVAATHNAPPAFVELRRHQPTIRASGALGRVVAGKRLVHISDCLDDASYKRGDADFVRFVDLCRVRSLILAPMLKDHDLMGVIGIYRTEVRPFSDKQIELVQNFAAQAVIAIENTRLLTELRHRTDDLTEALEQQTATSEVLQVISTSSGDLEPVFASMLENAVRISGAKFGIIHGWDGENSRLIATHNLPVAFDEARRRALQWRPGPKTAIRRMAATKKVVHIPNLVEDETYVEDHSPQVVAAVELGRVRTMLAVPTGPPGADGKARLARPVDRRHRPRDQEPAQFRQQFLIRLGRTDRRIAEALGGVQLDDKLRDEINEIADMLQGNLDKVVQHGKRADSIVKNMLLHSRAGSGEHRPVDINASSRRASISPITAHGPRSRASISRWSGLSTRPPARSICSRRRSRGCCST